MLRQPFSSPFTRPILHMQYGMLKRSSFSRSWKRHRKGKNFKFYSTNHHQNPPIHHPHIVSTNISITQHAKNGNLEIARKLFDEMPARTVVSWNTMISGYSNWGGYNDALNLVSLMHHSNVRLNETTFSTVLSVCARLGALSDGRQVHCLILKCGCDSFELVGSSLLYFYANCYQIGEARRVFDELRGWNGLVWSLMLVGYVQCNFMNEAMDVFFRMPVRDVISWTTLISGYSKTEAEGKKALELFAMMRDSREAIPNEFTFDCVIRTCGRLGLLREGMGVHGLLIRYGFEFDQAIGGALIDFYCSCDAIDNAIRVYDRIVNPCLNASNSLIGGLLLMSRIEDAELIFSRLTKTNPVSYNLMIKGYAMSGRIEDSKRLYDNMPHRTISSSNTMISVYSRIGEIDKALKLFEETKGERNPVTWNSMISGYIQNDRHGDALKLYVTMRRLLIDQTRSTFSALFHACSCLGSLEQGKLLHACLIKTPFELNVYVGTSLVDMYSKCGSIFDARACFSNISSPNVAAWTALINGYAHHGLGYEAVFLFEHMLAQGINPNGATFVGILSACGRAGLVNEGMRFFQTMKKDYDVTPTLEHYACLVDLLGRSGQLREAEVFIKEMPIEADGVVWGALLNACWFWMDMEVGERVAEKTFSLDPMPIYAYVIMSNIYSGLGRWAEKMKVRKRLRELEVKKDPGCSWIELNNRVFVFSVEDRTHPLSNVIYTTLEHLTSNVYSIVQFDYDSTPVTEANNFIEYHHR